MNAKLSSSLRPVYLTNPIVGIVKNTILTWYVAPKEVWFMDMTSLWDADNAAAAPPTVDHRFGITILDESSVDSFQVHMRSYAIPVETLRNMMREATDWGEYPGDYTPALLMDFDTKQVLNYYQEVGGEFQDFVPEGWQGSFKIAATQHIPLADKYWVINGEDLLKQNLPFA